MKLISLRFAPLNCFSSYAPSFSAILRFAFVFVILVIMDPNKRLLIGQFP